MNIVLLRGTLSSAPTHRDLPSGSRVVTYEVTTRSDDGPACSVPVAWFDPPSSAPALSEGREVVVAGQGAGGATGNVIAPANIVLGTSTAGIAGREGEILRKVLPWTVLTGVLTGIATIILNLF